MSLDVKTLRRIALDVGNGVDPDPSYSAEMVAAYDRMVEELKEARKKNPNAMLWIPADID